jgi:colicin import membrane protein
MSAVLAAPRAPRVQQNTASSFVLALAMHALLFAALWINVQWRTQPQGDVVAELWGALPPVEVAPPPPPPIVERAPEPERREAEIVMKQEKKAPPKKMPEPKKPEIDRRKVDEEKRAAAEREAIRKAEEKRMLAQAGTPSTAPATGGGRADAGYAEQLRALIRPRIVFAVPDGTSPQIDAVYQVDLLPTGEILGVKLLKPSGLPGYDAAVERAIRRTDPFPRKSDGSVDRTVTITFRPVEAQ